MIGLHKDNQTQTFVNDTTDTVSRLVSPVTAVEMAFIKIHQFTPEEIADFIYTANFAGYLGLKGRKELHIVDARMDKNILRVQLQDERLMRRETHEWVRFGEIKGPYSEVISFGRMNKYAQSFPRSSDAA